jgi:hypothetical protein
MVCAVVPSSKTRGLVHETHRSTAGCLLQESTARFTRSCIQFDMRMRVTVIFGVDAIPHTDEEV